MTPVYRGEADYRHGTAERVGILLANLGTPAEPQAGALRRYLRQFLSDPRVVEAPRWKWLPVLYGIVLPRRAPRSAAAYRKIWTDEGSPLLVNCRAIRDGIAAAFADAPAHVEIGMNYGEPSIVGALRRLQKENCRRIAVLPLYPQYSGSTTGAAFDAVSCELRSWRAVPHLRFVASYADDPRYIEALAESIVAHWREHGRPDRLVFSFHGTPTRMLEKGDPYYCMCMKTARLAAERLDMPGGSWVASFQSRFGREEWLQPYTDEVLKALPTEGARHVQAVCPAFSADCLETLEEIAQEGRDVFMEAGGEQFSYIPALNAFSAHVDFLVALIRDAVSDWLSRLETVNDPAALRAQREATGRLRITLPQEFS